MVGAGPYGLSTAAHALRRGIETVVLGEPMGFWRRNMPQGMLLRSGVDWHLDADEHYTFEAFLEERGLVAAEVHPIPLDLFIDYADWFRTERGVAVLPQLVSRLEHADGCFVATLDNGGQVTADAVVAAPGLARFAAVPDWVPASLPPTRWSHTVTCVDLPRFAGASVLILGGRQSAYEWAALLVEAGAASVYVVHRHDQPRFEEADWSFTDALIEQTVAQHGWFRRLPAADRDAVSRRFWAEGRLKLEPWLPLRLPAAVVRCRANTEVVECRENGAEVEAILSNGERLVVDHVLLATGYRPDLGAVPYLEGLVDRLEVADGFPVLDENFQTSLPGLFMPGFVATRDFGPFFGFVRGCTTAAVLIVAALLEARLGAASARS